MSSDALLSTLFGGLLSLVGSLVAGAYFFRRSSKELRNEVGELRGQVGELRVFINTLSRVMEEPGAKFMRDKAKMMTGGKLSERSLGGEQPAPEGTLTAEKNREP